MVAPDIALFGARLAATRSFDAALDLLAEAAQSLGFVGVDYAALPSARVLDGSWAGLSIFERNFPRDWQRGWRIHGRFDPILPTSYREGLPLDWQAVRGRASLSAAEREAIAFLDGMGFPSGITVPIHLPRNEFAFVSGVSRLDGTQWQALCAEARAPLMVLAHTFHHLTVERRAPSTARDFRLTRRERECLQHAALGQAAPATALHMNRSVDTVRRHLKAAIAKLGARTIAQAVAVAVGCGLIDADARGASSSD